jgi:hypothetical protein
VFKVIAEMILANEDPPSDPGLPQMATANFPSQGID